MMRIAALAITQIHASIHPILRTRRRQCRRRRLGPWRPEAARDGTRQRDIAAMARAGYYPDLARRVIDAVDVDALDDWAADAEALPDRRRPGSTTED